MNLITTLHRRLTRTPRRWLYGAGLSLILLVAAAGVVLADGRVLIVFDDELRYGQPVLMSGLPREGYGCDGIYWRYDRPEYQNRVSVHEFTVDARAEYRVFINIGIRTPLVLPDGVVMTDELRERLLSAYPRPYLMLYEGTFDANRPTAFCLWAARDERTPFFISELNPDTTYYLVVSHEGDSPEWTFPYRVTVERLTGVTGVLCYHDTLDPACNSPHDAYMP